MLSCFLRVGGRLDIFFGERFFNFFVRFCCVRFIIELKSFLCVLDI